MDHQASHSTPLVSCKDVELLFGDRLVLQDVHFSLEPGKIHMLVGPNGGGKTTLLRLLLGLIRPSRGTIQWRSPDGSVSNKAIPFGYVPQRSVADIRYPVTVRDVISMVRLATHPSPGSDPVEKAIERLRLEALADRPFNELSGGEQQRTLIARALALESSAIFLDEPGNGLDFTSQRELIELLQELRDQHSVAILFSTHHPGEALSIVDHGFRINRSVESVPCHLLEDDHAGPPCEASGHQHG